MEEEKLTKKERLDYLLSYVHEVGQLTGKHFSEIGDALKSIQSELDIKQLEEVEQTVIGYDEMQKPIYETKLKNN